MSDSNPKHKPPGSLHRLVASFTGLMQSHLGVFSIELEEARERLVKLLLLVILGAGAVLLCLLTLTLAVILMVSEAYRLYAVIALLVIFIALGGICLGLAWRDLSRGPAPFAVTLDELRRDKERLLP